MNSVTAAAVGVGVLAVAPRRIEGLGHSIRDR
jgi:hypothetical protein